MPSSTCSKRDVGTFRHMIIVALSCIDHVVAICGDCCNNKCKSETWTGLSVSNSALIRKELPVNTKKPAKPFSAKTKLLFITVFDQCTSCGVWSVSSLVKWWSGGQLSVSWSTFKILPESNISNLESLTSLDAIQWPEKVWRSVKLAKDKFLLFFSYF